MKKNFIDRFFIELDRALGVRAEIILTGAAEGALMGNVRPSVDVDFEIRPAGKRVGQRTLPIREAIQKASARTGLAANYSENIGHGSMIDYLDYRRSALPYQMIGKLRIKLMAPGNWTIGKMSRYLDPDIQDVLATLAKQRLSWRRLARIWGRALKASPPSCDQFLFRQHVEHFLKSYGKRIWGKGFHAENALRVFHTAAGIGSG